MGTAGPPSTALPNPVKDAKANHCQNWPKEKSPTNKTGVYGVGRQGGQEESGNEGPKSVHQESQRASAMHLSADYSTAQRLSRSVICRNGFCEAVYDEPGCDEKAKYNSEISQRDSGGMIVGLAEWTPQADCKRVARDEMGQVERLAGRIKWAAAAAGNSRVLEMSRKKTL